MKKFYILLLALVSFVYSQNVQKYNESTGNFEDFFPLGWYSNLDYGTDESISNSFEYLNEILYDGFSNTLLAYHYGNTPIIDYYTAACSISNSVNKDLNLIVPTGVNDGDYHQYLAITTLEAYPNILKNVLSWYLFDEPSLEVKKAKDGDYSPYPSDIKTFREKVEGIDDVVDTEDNKFVRQKCIVENTYKYWYNDYVNNPPLLSTNPDIFLPPDVEQTTYGQNSDFLMVDVYTISKWTQLYYYMYNDYLGVLSPENRKKKLDAKFPLKRPTLIRLPLEICKTILVNDSVSSIGKDKLKPVIAVLQAEENLTCLYKVYRTGPDGLPNTGDEDYDYGYPMKIKKDEKDNIIYDDSGNIVYEITTDPLLFVYKKWDPSNVSEIKGNYLYKQFRVLESERGEDSSGNRGLYFEEILYNTFTSLVHGAKGLVYYGMHRVNNDMRINIKNIAKSLLDLGIDQMILTDDLPVICNRSYNYDDGLTINDEPDPGEFEQGTADDNNLIDINQTLRYNKTDGCYYLIVTNDSKEVYTNIRFILPFETENVKTFNFDILPSNSYFTEFEGSYQNDSYTKTSALEIPSINNYGVKLFKIKPKQLYIPPTDGKATHPLTIESHKERISEDIVWTSDKIHRITKNIEIAQNVTLTIEPGTIVVFDAEKINTEDKIHTKKITVNGKIIFGSPDLTKAVTIMNPNFEFKSGSSFEMYKNIRLIGNTKFVFEDLDKTYENENINILPVTTQTLPDNCLSDNLYLLTESLEIPSSSSIILQNNTCIYATNQNSELTIKGDITIATTCYPKLNIPNINIGYDGNIIFEIGAGIELGGNTKLTGSLVLPSDCTLKLIKNSALTVELNSSLKIKQGSIYYMQDGSNLLIKSLEADEPEVTVSSLISGLVIEPEANIVINGSANISGKVNLPVECKYKLMDNSELFFGDGCALDINSATITEIGKNSKIVVQNEGSLNVNGAFLTAIDSWQGIVGEIGSSIYLSGVSISGAETALTYIQDPNQITQNLLTITNCNFSDCVNGIKLIGSNNFKVENNNLTGKMLGTGISLTHSEGRLYKNTISNFSHGMDLTTCSPILTKNIIKDNVNYGLCALGWNTTPQLIDPSTTKNYLNNDIKGNGIAQIYLKYSASAYMTNGKNNVYSGIAGVVPDVPCILGVSNTAITAKAALPSRVDIDAENNYWGSMDLEQIPLNYYKYFTLWAPDVFRGYRLFYDPYFISPLRYETIIPISQVSEQSAPDPSSILLDNAIKQELDGNLKSSIKLYENVLKKDSTTAEAAVALARLPLVYLQSGLVYEPLIQLYDAAIVSDDVSNKKFYKEMKVSTYLKNKKYDEAIAVAEEMKAEAETDGEILISDIDIAIANMLKSSAGKGSKNSLDYTGKLIKLLTKLTENDETSEPTDITEANLLPTEHALYQNYPNPFNPVTQIKFDIAALSNVKLNIYNTNGQLVANLIDGKVKQGFHTANFDASKLNSGVYIYTLQVDGKAFSKKMVLIK